MFKWIKDKLTVEKTVYVEYRPDNEYKIITVSTRCSYAMHKGHNYNGLQLYEYGSALGLPLVCEWDDYVDIMGEPEKYFPISINQLNPDAPITSSLGLKIRKISINT